MKKILVTGGSGLVGKAIQQICTDDAVFVSSKDFNLLNESDVHIMFETHKPTHVIHLAGKVGGVGINLKKPVDFFEENIIMNTLILKYANLYNVDRLIAFMSTCIFPNDVEYPLQPQKMHLGEPHFSNFGYAYAKRMLDVQLKAYQTQYNRDWFAIIPTNIYGPYDNFNLEESHVIPALIHKCHLAKENNTPLKIWGTGSAIREFIHSHDVAKLTIALLDNYTSTSPIIVSTSQQTSIKEVVELIVKHMNFEGEIVFDDAQPEGQQRKPSDITPLLNLFSNYEYVSIDSGLQTTIEWFMNNYNTVRK
jgi:GDP-L-fucose synthase